MGKLKKGPQKGGRGVQRKIRFFEKSEEKDQ
jgi:hypothetical protein